MRRLAVFLVAAAIVPAGALAATPKTTHTKAGMAAAKRALLGAGAFPNAWTSSAPAEKKVPSLACAAAGIDPTGVVEIGSAVTPHYRGSSAGPFASESVYVFKTPAQTARLWKRLVARGLGGCLATSITQGSTQDVSFSRTKQLPVQAPRIAGRTAAYRVSARASTPGQAITAYFDLVLVTRGSSIAALSFSSFSEPPPAGIEALLSRAAISRLH
jgi:hypothetical protein